MRTDDLQHAMHQAMKARRTGEVAALRLAVSALKSAAIELRRDLTEDEVAAVLSREAKKRREAEQAFRDAGRTDRADQERAELEVLSRFLPEQLSGDELARLVDEVIAATGARSPGDLGKVMGRLMPVVKGRADGNEIRRLVAARLTR
jgi:uncharacterized protein YqeY